MAEGGWVVLGSAIGTLGSIGTTWLASFLGKQSKFPKYDKAIRELLLKMLQGEPRWRKVQTLAAVTGLTVKEVKEYLVELKARGSETNGNLWGLIERNPLKAIQVSDEEVGKP